MPTITPSPTEIMRGQTSEVVISGEGVDFAVPGTPLTMSAIPVVADDPSLIVSQVIDSATQVTLQIRGGGAVATLTITDPVSGARCQVLVVVVVPVLPRQPRSSGYDELPGGSGYEERPLATGEDY